MKKYANIISAALVFLILIGFALKLHFDIICNDKTLSGLKSARDEVSRNLELCKNEGIKLQRALRDSNELLKRLELGFAKLSPGNDTDENYIEEAEDELDRWIGRIDKLKGFISDNQKYEISEFKYLDDNDWLWATERQMETEADYRKTLALLRRKAKWNTVTVLNQALSDFYKAHNGNSPQNYEDIQPYLPSDFDSSRYTNNLSGENPPGVPVPSPEKYGQWIIKDVGPVDDIWDSGLWTSEKGITLISEITWEPANAVSEAIKKYVNENGNQPTSSEQIIKYIKYSDDMKEMNEESIDKIYKSIMKPVK